jgi:ribosomal protein S21
VSKPAHVVVSLDHDGKGSVDRMIRKFLKKYKEAGIAKEVSRRKYFVSKSVARRNKKHRGKKRAQTKIAKQR